MVLIYHRVIDLEHDPQQLAVHPENFRDQVKYLKERFTIVSLSELVKRISTGKSTENCAAVTFDDGYADNLYYAKPILEEYTVPATVFVTAGMVGSRRESWWDELERIFLIEGKCFKSLKIEINRQEHKWNIGSREDSLEVYRQIHPLIKYISHEKREKILDNLFDWAELDRDTGRETHRIMNRDELRELIRGGLVEIGSHSFTHSALSAEPMEKLQLEIEESKRILEQIIRGSIHSFSYPFGQKRDIDTHVIQRVKDAGYVCGIANIQANLNHNTDLYMIPRRLIRNWDLTEFQQKVNNFLQSNRLPHELKPGVNLYLDNLKPCVREYLPGSSKRKIRNVLFLNHLDQKGGAARLCYQMFDHLGKKRFDVNLLVRKKLSVDTDDKIKKIIETASDDQKSLSAFQEQEGWLDVFHFSSFDLKHSRQFKEADVVHLHNLHKNYFSLLALPEITCLKPVVWTLHDMFSFTGHCVNSYGCQRWGKGCGNCPDLNIEPRVKKDNTHLLWRLKKIVYRYSDFSPVCPSVWLKSKLENSILKDKEITLIYNGVDETVFKNHHKRKARNLLNLPQDKAIILFVSFGGLTHKTKGGHLIDGVLERLIKENLLILVVGHIGDNIERENLKTLPYIEDTKKLALYYSAADLFLYPSLADNCPLVVLESLSCGTPVVSFNTGGIPELVRHKETGYIAEYKNIDELAAGVEFFLGKPALLKKAGRKARQSVLKTFTLKKMIKKYLELYESRYRDFMNRRHTIDESYKIKIAEILRNPGGSN